MTYIIDIAERFLLKLIITQLKVAFLADSLLNYKKKHGNYIFKEIKHFSVRRIRWDVLHLKVSYR